MTHTRTRQRPFQRAGQAGPGRAPGAFAPGRAFTLLELLVTVGILSVLAMMAMPYYQQAHMRSKIAASKCNIRMVRDALEVYRIDQGRYPLPVVAAPAEDPCGVVATSSLRSLTTPIAYVSPETLRDSFGLIQAQGTAQPVADDPFRPPEGGDAFAAPEPQFNKSQSLLYFHYPTLAASVNNPAMRRQCYAIVSVGPDRKDSFIVYYPFPQSLPLAAAQYGIVHIQDTVYDPTNGVICGGDLAGFGPEAHAPQLLGGGGQ